MKGSGLGRNWPSDLNSTLYAIATQGERSLEDYLNCISQLISGGVGIVQMREKNMGADKRRALGEALLALCSKHHVPLVVNDDPHLARAIGANGVHVGQDDLAPEEVRKIVGPDCAIGLSTHSAEQVERANQDNEVDMLGFGPIFHTRTKDAGDPLGRETIIRVFGGQQAKPVWLIGGISLANVGQIAGLVGGGVAVSSALFSSSEPKEAAQEFVRQLEGRPS